MAQLQLSKAESPWVTGVMLAFSLTLMALVVSLPLLFRTFLFQPFNIPAGSMKPTLLVGDYFFVSKYTYGYSRYTWPFAPPSSGRIWGSEPERGDVVAFLLPKDNATVYVKRVVGLPGDRIQMKSGELYINGTPVPRERLADVVGTDACGEGTGSVKHWRETLNGKSYETLDCVDNGFYDNTIVYTVPAGHLFMLGDNRDNSTDSRVRSAVGDVPIENVIGRAAMIFFSIEGAGKGEPSGIRFGRIGMIVR
jgi:signal peptidase I